MKINKQRVGGAILATKKFIKNCKNKEKGNYPLTTGNNLI